jgi:acylphosphatase
MAAEKADSEMPEKGRLAAAVRGRVQGVFFRHFVASVARELGLAGYVRNLASGDTVEVVAEGERTLLNSLLDRLAVGPAGAHVEGTDVEWSDYSGEFTDFRILR